MAVPIGYFSGGHPTGDPTVRAWKLIALVAVLGTTGCEPQLPEYNSRPHSGFDISFNSALEGNSGAMNILAGALLEGNGVSRDYVEAYRWARAAARCWPVGVRVELMPAAKMDELERRMTEDELRRARRPAAQDRIPCA